ncbi:Cthe_2314 family HEPN domain-containing protein [Paenibacillus chitinolyticus]
MLRTIFNETKRSERSDERLEQAFTSIKRYLNVLQQSRHSSPSYSPKKLHRLYVWSQGFLDALDELEESKYCAGRFAERVKKSYLDEMQPEELDDYRRYVYFYKNALIRLFSVLDKLGYFLNDLFDLKTETLKTHFSFFTVLRKMRESGIHPALQQKLYELKTEAKQPLQVLRNQRNMEIHYVNVEMLDDLMLSQSYLGDRIQVENIADNLAQMNRGYEMVCITMDLVFRYISRGSIGENGEENHGGGTQNGSHHGQRERARQNGSANAGQSRV